MWIEDRLMDTQERIGYRLMDLYDTNGYNRYRMSKFEEYDLYSRNRDFLLSENVITFTDTNGRLMAMKPDVTLSIVKNMKDAGRDIRKLYYYEHVYRAADETEGFREQTQVGLECMGQISAACISGVLTLAARSLQLCSEHSVLEISHLGILKTVTDELSGEHPEIKTSLLHCVSEKNTHGITDICREAGIEAGKEETLQRLIGLYGSPEKVLEELHVFPESAKLKEMISELEHAVSGIRSAQEQLNRHIIIDFSATEDLRYYNGIAFKGFIEGIPESVLSGGQYDGLMRRMGRKDQAIGFAVFLNRLERLREGESHA
ncbi:MAG: ATP phosphoribosyltransferase regulatory subunit [Clostridia bacterium]|nr:ATP phosphoribosyltransferase regulatory subunit [Clostridia bacterium]